MVTNMDGPFDIMLEFEKKFGSYATAAQCGRRVCFPCENNKILIYDSQSNTSSFYNYKDKDLPKDNLIGFSWSLFEKDIGKLTKKAESIFQFSLYNANDQTGQLGSPSNLTPSRSYSKANIQGS